MIRILRSITAAVIVFSSSSLCIGQSYPKSIQTKEVPKNISPLINKLKNSILITCEADETMKYVKVDIGSLRYMNPHDSIDSIRLKELRNDKKGRSVINDDIDSNKHAIYTFQAIVKDVCSGDTSKYYIGFEMLDDDEASLAGKAGRCIYYDGSNIYYQLETNPQLSSNPDKYYMVWNDISNCPLKILAYRIAIDEYDNVNVSLVVRNSSNKTIVGFKGLMRMYDKMNEPVTWGGSNNLFRYSTQEEVIEPKSQPKEIGVWKLTLYDRTRRVKPSIYKLQYDDGKIWNSK